MWYRKISILFYKSYYFESSIVMLQVKLSVTPAFHLYGCLFLFLGAVLPIQLLANVLRKAADH